MTPYIGFTLHWIDNKWVLRNRCLGTKYVPEEHTGQQLEYSLSEILTDWKLDETKMAAITTDYKLLHRKSLQGEAMAQHDMLWPQFTPGNHHNH